MVLPSRGISKNYEMPIYPIPTLHTYVLNQNNFYSLNRIEYGKFYYLLSGGLSSYEVIENRGSYFGWEISLRNIYVDNGDYRYTTTIPFKYTHGNSYNSESIGVSHRITHKIFSATSLSIDGFTKALHVYDSYFDERLYNFVTGVYGYGFGLQQHLTRFLSIEFRYQWDRNKLLLNYTEPKTTSFIVKTNKDLDFRLNIFW